MPKFLGEIKLNGGDFALLDSSNIRGGFVLVKTTAERDSIIPDKLKVNMLAYVEEEERIYRWRGDKWTIWEIDRSNPVKITPFTRSTTVREITEEEEYYKILFEDNIFIGNDIVGFNINEDLTGEYFEIEYVREGAAYISKEASIPNKYQTVYLMGSTSDKSRLLVLILHEYNGALVLSQFLNISIDNINTNYFFRLGQSDTDSWKAYGEDVYFKGTFIDEKGRNLSEVVDINLDIINNGLTSVRREFSYDNLLNNPFFINGMDCWLTKNTAMYFKANNKWVMTHKTLLSTKRDGAFVVVENNQAILRLVHGFISLRNEDLKKIVNLDAVEPPYYVSLIFNYKPITEGTFKVSIRNSAEGTIYKSLLDMLPEEEYKTWKSTFLWDGTGDFTLEYTGEIKIQTIVLKMDDVKNLELKYEELFQYSDTLVKMAKEYLNNT